ncbi:hypothetical protein B0H13DRAFT_1915492 [Mycena leptocephala]|nr:hypothetical protein B0H13DRAFT_1915492 [Mycena leptocephala]
MSPACPKPSFVCGPKSSMSKVEDVSIWLRWAVDPASGLPVLLRPLLALPMHFLLPLLRPYLPLSLQGVGKPFTAFFLLSHPTPTPERLSAAVVRPELVPTTQLYLKGLVDLALLACSVVLFSFLQLLLSHSLFPALARRWGIRKAGKVARFREQGLAVVYFAVVGVWGVYTLSTTPVSSALNASTAHFWLDYPHNHVSGPMNRYYLSQIAYWLQQALSAPACAFSAASARLSRIDGAIRLRLAHRSFF